MGLLARTKAIINSKIDKIMDRAEDPRETLDYSYEKQLELLQNVRKGVADVATSKKRLELQKARLKASIEKTDDQAREALKSDREDLAKLALERKIALQGQIDSLDRQIEEVDLELQKLTTAESRLNAKVESFRSKKETIKAQYTAAEAQARVTESVTGISEEMADVGIAIQRAEDKTETMKARSAALDELLESGVLEDYTAEDRVSKELSQIRAQSSVDDELAKLKQEMNK
jgi:phage shock protein A